MANTPRFHGTPIIEDKHGKILRPITRGQQELLETMESNDIVFVNGPAGTGKAQPLTAKILTPNGWKLMGDVNVGDKIFAYDGSVCNITGIFPQGKKDIYEVIFDDNSKTHSCIEHLWETKNELERDKRSSTYDIPSVKELSLIKETLYGHDNRLNHSIPMVNSINFTESELPIDPYFIGLLLGDGSTRGGKVSITNVDDEIIKYCYDLSEKYDCCIRKDKISYIFKKSVRNSSSKSAINEIIINLGLMNKLSYDKFIPDIYKYTSIDNRISILQGLLDSDGSISKSGYVIEYSTTSKLLSDDVKFIVQSLGGKVSITEKNPTYVYKGIKKTGHISYRMIIKLPADILPFRLTRKAERYIPKSKYIPVRYIKEINFVGNEECQCIFIDHPRHLYITDDFIVTHNTVIATWYGIAGIDSGIYDKLVLTRPIMEAGEELGFLPGTFEEKVAPYMQPLYEAIETVKGKRIIPEMDTKLGTPTPQSSYRDKKGMMKKKTSKDINIKPVSNDDFYKKVNVCPLAYLRGSTKAKSFIILDEAQNTTTTQMKLMLTRLGKGSKLIICGDINQSDLERSSQSGFREAQQILEGVEGIGFVTLDVDDIVRHKLIRDIIIRYENKNNRKNRGDVFDNRFDRETDQENYRDMRNYDLDDDDLDDADGDIDDEYGDDEYDDEYENTPDNIKPMKK